MRIKLFCTIAAVSFGGFLFEASLPARASVLVELHAGTATLINDGNPYAYTAQGCRTEKSYRANQMYAYPVKGEGPGARRTIRLSQSDHQFFAEIFSEAEMDGYTYKNSAC